MKTWQEHAAKALEVYVMRGEHVLQMIEAGQVDEALSVLDLRRIALINFRYYDELANRDGANSGAAELVRVLVDKAQVLEKKLETALSAAMSKEKQSLQQIVTARKKIRSYKSGQELNSHFERTV